MAARWTLRRTGARRPVVLALASLIAVTAFLLAGIAGYGSRVGTVGLRDFLGSADAGASSLQVQSRLAPNPAAQQRAADSLFGTLFAGLHVTVLRSVTLPPVAVTATTRSPDGAPAGDPTVRLASFDGLRRHAHLVSGAWPDLAGAGGSARPAGTHRVPAAIEQDAARRLHLSVGSTLSIGNTERTTFQVAAIWAPDRAGDPYFAADAAGARGPSVLAADRAAAGFVAVPMAVLAAKGADALVNWTIVPDAARIVPAEMLAMSAAVDKAPDAVTADRAMAPLGSVSAGDLAGTLRTVTASIIASQAVSPVPSLLVAAISVLMLIQLSRLLAIERRSETALIRSRGASAGQLTRIAVVEGAAIAVPAAAAGAGAATGVLAFSQAAVPLTGWVLAAATALVAITAITVPAAHHARLPANRQQIDDSGRIRAVTATSTVLLVLIAAGVALWRFLRTGSALVTGADGSTHIDPIAVLAPALVLIAAAVVAGVLFGMLAGAVEAITSRARGLGTVLAARQIARRGTVFGVVVILVAIAIGAVGMAATYSATQSVTQTRTDILTGGAPLTATLPTVDPLIPGPYHDIAGRASAGAAVGTTLPVLHEPVTLGDVDASLLSVSSTRMSAVVPAAGRSFEPDRLATVLAGKPAGVPLPDGTTAVTTRLAVAAAWQRESGTIITKDGTVIQQPSPPGPAGLTTPLGLVLWIQSPTGALTPVAAGTVDAVAIAPRSPGTAKPATLTAALPRLVAGSRIVAVDLTTPILTYPLAVELSIASVTAVTAGTAESAGGTVPVDLAAGHWTAAPLPPDTSGLRDEPGQYRLTSSDGTLRLSGTAPAGAQWTARIAAAGPAALPVAVDRELADKLQVGLGAPVTIALDSARQFPARIVAISPLLPGDAGTPKVLADLPQLQEMLLRSTPNLPATNELWAAPSDPAGATASLQALIPSTSTISEANTRSTQALIAPTTLTLWFGAAGALLLAAIGVGSVIATLSVSRRGELVVLRSVGVTARSQARSRARELAATTVVGWLLGIGVAAVAVLTTVADLAGSAVVGSLGVTPTLHVGWLVAAILIGAHVLIVAAIVAADRIRLRRQVLRSTPSELVL